VYRLGYMGTSSALPAPLAEGLRDLGYVEDQNLVVELRDDGGQADRSADLAAELAVLPVDVIVVPGSIGVVAAKQATSTIPIVCLGLGADLVRLGLVDSLSRPGGNVTGLTSANDRLLGKRLQLLTEAAPPVARVAVVWESRVGPFPHLPFEQPAQALGIEILALEVQDPDGLDGAFEAAVRDHADAVYVIGTPLTVRNRARVVALAAHHRLPAMYEVDVEARAGGLMAYQASRLAMERRAAYFVDRILKGTKPADLPVEQPMTFDFVVNMKTARELGITFPREILLQVTEVIE
jgi:putative ABC transport system substrate-binding protein